MKGKYLETTKKQEKQVPIGLEAASFFAVELFCFFFLSWDTEAFDTEQLWPLAFGVLWSGILGGVIRILPWTAGRILYGITYFLAVVYAGFQTGYYIMFSQMMWLSDFRYASEGADYASVLLHYPPLWWLGMAALLIMGICLLKWFPKWNNRLLPKLAATVLVVAGIVGAWNLPQAVFRHDSSIRYAASDYGRAQSAEAAYTNMFNTHRLYQVCGMYQTAVKDLYNNSIYPLMPAYQKARQEGVDQIGKHFREKPEAQSNAMTGVLKGKNIILVLMESMDDWMIGEHTPTISRLMEEGISFTNFYTPGFGGIRTFNTEFCINTGSFLSSEGGYAFDYVTNHFQQSLANVLRESGYSAKTFHYNDPSFYSRGEFSPAMGYEDYVCYADYLDGMDEEAKKQLLYDDKLLFDNEGLHREFFRGGKPTLNFIITRSAHLSYKYNEVLSHWGLKQYPDYRGLTGNEETDCALLKAKLVDDMFARMLEALREEGTLENTVVIGVTDHYTYGYKDMQSLYALSGTQEELLLEKTPCFIWSPDIQSQKVTKTLNTADFLPTVLNLLGVESRYAYLGSDAFDDRYAGFVPFSNGSWISGNYAYDAAEEKLLILGGNKKQPSAAFLTQMDEKVHQFISINNLILETDYYRQ